MVDVTVTAAREADLESVTRIYGHYVTHSVATFEEVVPSAAEWHAKLATLHARRLPFVVARDAGAVLGFAYAAPWRTKPAYRFTVEDTIYLAPGETGRGVGRLLLADVIQGCARAGMRRMIAVITDAGDPASVRLHVNAGFVEAGRLTAVGYKHDRWLDTILLQRDLTEGRQA